jgi:hypothetical protein
MSQGGLNRKPSYKWSISKGRIGRGQHTSQIEIDASAVNDETTVTVEVGKVILKPCPKTASEKIRRSDYERGAAEQRLERTRRLPTSIRSCVGEPLKRNVGFLLVTKHGNRGPRQMDNPVRP